MNNREIAQKKYAEGWRPQRLLSRENVKIQKAEKFGWQGMGLSLAPANISGFDVCASRSPECEKYCIFTAGRGLFPKTSIGRIIKTLWMFQDRKAFLTKLYRDVANNRHKVIRLNVFSDWQWERQTIHVTPELAERYNTKSGDFRNLMEVFPDTQFYDYTKHEARMFRVRPKNYHLTFSLMENNSAAAKRVIRAGMNVAAVVTDKKGSLFGYPIIDGDLHDLRFLDPGGVFVGLDPKGELKKHLNSEFIYETDLRHFRYPSRDSLPRRGVLPPSSTGDGGYETISLQQCA